jgi:hypothetical protein
MLFVTSMMLLAGGAAAAGLAAGTYVIEGGAGTLKLQAEAGGRQAFTIETVGGNAHVCTLDGVVRNGLAVVPTSGRQACKVRFVPRSGGIEVTDASTDLSACREFCGARAGFAATYLPLPATCEQGAMEKRFQAAYRAKQYGQAHAVLDPFVRDCARFTDWSALARLRNDLAITRFHLGDLPGCRRALEPLREDIEASDDALRQKNLPTDADTAIAFAQAARFNWRKCAPR